MEEAPLIVLGITEEMGADYFEWIDMGAFVGLDNPYWMEYTFLKDNLAAAGTWTSLNFQDKLHHQRYTFYSYFKMGVYY